METKPPASTNGASQPIFDFNEVVTVPYELLVDVHLYIDREAPRDHVPTVVVEWDKEIQALTHSSATAAYAIYKSYMDQKGQAPLAFRTWLVIASSQIRQIREQGIVTSKRRHEDPQLS
jgi:hypothetical protein